MSTVLDVNRTNDSSVKKSNVFLRAARSITKTKSVSGNFIVKTMICKNSNIKRNQASNEKEQSVIADTNGVSMPNIVK